MSTELTIYNNLLVIHDDLPKYTSAYYDIQDRLDKATATINQEDNIGRLLSASDEIIKSNTDAIVQKLVDAGIYDYTYEQLRATNPGVARMMDAFSAYMSHMEGVSAQTASAAQSELNRAADKAASQIHGLEFGILTSSIVSMMIYDSFNESEIKKSTEKAQGYLDTQRNRIMQQKDAIENRASKTYIQDKLKPALESGLVEYFSGLLAQYIKALSDNGRINPDCIKGIDEVKSSRMIDNISKASDKQDLLGKAAALCPYNARVYTSAYDYGFLDEALGSIICSLNCYGLTNRVIEWIKKNSGLASDRDLQRENTSIIELFSKYGGACTAIANVTGDTRARVFGRYIRNVLQLKIENLKKYVSALKSGKPEKIIPFLGSSTQSLIPTDREMAGKSLLPSYLSRQDYDCIKANTNVDVDSLLTDAVGTTVESFDDLKDYIDGAVDQVMPIIEAEINRGRMEQAEKKAAEERAEKEAEEQKKDAEQKAKKRRTTIIAVVAVATLAAAGGFVLKTNYQNAKIERTHAEAAQLAEEGNLDAAETLLSTLTKDIDGTTYTEFSNEINYLYAKSLNNSGRYEEAIAKFEALGGYQDSTTLKDETKMSFGRKLTMSDNLEDVEKGIELLKTIENNGELAEAYYKKATILDQEGKYIDALHTLTEANIDKEERAKAIISNALIAYYNQGEPGKATDLGFKYDVKNDVFKQACYKILSEMNIVSSPKRAEKFADEIRDMPEARELVVSADNEYYYSEGTKKAYKGELREALADFERVESSYKDTSIILNLCKKYYYCVGLWQCIKYVGPKYVGKGEIVEEIIDSSNDSFKNLEIEIRLLSNSNLKTTVSYTDTKDATLSGNTITWEAPGIERNVLHIDTGVRDRYRLETNTHMQYFYIYPGDTRVGE